MTIIARHKVGSMDAFLKGQQERVELFAPAASSWQTFQDADDPQSVVLVIDVADMEKFGAILNDPRNVEMRARHTVLPPVVMSMPVPA